VPIHPLSSSQTPVFLLNSRLGLFTAPSLRRDPFSRSYGVILPSSLARVLSFALVSSTHLPVSVCGTGIPCAPYEVFLVSVESSKFSLTAFPITPQPSRCADLPAHQPQCLDLNHHQAQTILLRPPFGQTHIRWYWNINQLSISYALRPRLRPD
jgi:hypothetical protein